MLLHFELEGLLKGILTYDNSLSLFVVSAFAWRKRGTRYSQRSTKDLDFPGKYVLRIYTLVVRHLERQNAKISRYRTQTKLKFSLSIQVTSGAKHVNAFNFMTRALTSNISLERQCRAVNYTIRTAQVAYKQHVMQTRYLKERPLVPLGGE